MPLPSLCPSLAPCYCAGPTVPPPSLYPMGSSLSHPESRLGTIGRHAHVVTHRADRASAIVVPNRFVSLSPEFRPGTIGRLVPHQSQYARPRFRDWEFIYSFGGWQRGPPFGSPRIRYVCPRPPFSPVLVCPVSLFLSRARLCYPFRPRVPAPAVTGAIHLVQISLLTLMCGFVHASDVLVVTLKCWWYP